MIKGIFYKILFTPFALSSRKIQGHTIWLFSLLLPLRTGRTEIKCAGTFVLAYAGVLRHLRWCRQNSHVICSEKDDGSLPACGGNTLYRLIYSGVLQNVQVYLFRWLFWSTPSALKNAKSSPPQMLWICYGGLDLAVPFTPSTQTGRTEIKCARKICAGVLRSTPSSEVV